MYNALPPLHIPTREKPIFRCCRLTKRPPLLYAAFSIGDGVPLITAPPG
jgi:hypothetical protein